MQDNEILLKKIQERIDWYRNQAGIYANTKQETLALKYEHLASGLEMAHKIVVSA